MGSEDWEIVGIIWVSKNKLVFGRFCKLVNKIWDWCSGY